MRAVFATYARDHESCVDPPLLVHVEYAVYLPHTGEQLAANPMQLVGGPKLARPYPSPPPRCSGGIAGN
jgi:integrase/recombinase XerC